jgi:hypothetical protein
MSSISATELELLSLFEVVPKLRDPEEPWEYNDALYEMKQGELSLSFSVAPSYKDVRLILKRGNATLYEFNATGVEDVKYQNDSGRESLEIVINEQDRLLLKVKPIGVLHEARRT